MCGRFALDEKVAEAIVAFVEAGGETDETLRPGWEPNYNVSPTDPVPLLRERVSRSAGGVVRVAESASWDFRPAWLRSPGLNINARLESVASTPLYSSAFRSHRCLIPMIGYYEWDGPKDRRRPHFLHGPDAVLMAAGVYAVSKDVKTGDCSLSTAIITRQAKDASGAIHERMPVFLTDQTWGTWLQPGEIAQVQRMVRMLDEVSAEVAASLTGYPVTTELNNSRSRDRWDDPALIDPVEA